VHDSPFLVGIVIAAAVLLARALARRIGIPDAVAFVVLGAIGSLVPGASHVRVSPDVVLLLFLPPLIFFAGFFSDEREVRANFGTITGLAVGLVIATTAGVAAVLHQLVPQIGWAAALALGAAVAPPDPVAATSVMNRLGVPRRVATILEGEGMINDGISLTLFALALESVGQTVTVGHAVLRAVEAVVGGIAFGLAIGFVITKVRTHIRDMGSQIVVSLLTPYLAYIPAERLHGSGVLATLAAATFLGTRGRGLFQPAARVQTETFWRVLVFLVEATLFVLLGLEAREIVQGISDQPPGIVAITSVCIVLTAVAIRLAWQLFLPPLVAHFRRGDDVLAMPRRERALIGWCGLRGAISLAIALSIPVTLDGRPFPGRSLLLFLTLVVVLATLLGQGSTLPLAIRVLGVAQSKEEQGQELHGRQMAAEAALKELEELVSSGKVEENSARTLRPLYEARLERLRSQSADEDVPESSQEVHRLRLRLIKVQRQALQQMYESDQIGADVRLEISRELDLEEAGLRRTER
jgi:CPA1 family monovalent cation:H+ antiporter